MQPQQSHTTAEQQPAFEVKIHPTRHLKYMEQDCEMTVREGLQEYYTQIEDLITADNASAETAQMFHYHDLVHVVFGCDTSLVGEMLADSWAISGTTVKLSFYMDYFKLPEVKALTKATLTWPVLRQTFGSFSVMPKVWWRTRKMTKKWPYRDNAQYLDMPLRELREALNIQVVVVDTE